MKLQTKKKENPKLQVLNTKHRKENICKALYTEYTNLKRRSKVTENTKDQKEKYQKN